MSDLQTITGIGPATEADMIRAGIPDAETLRALGAHEAYVKMVANGKKPHFIAYYALHMSLQGRPWNDCKGKEKDALRKQYDTLQAARKPMSELDKFMDDIGLIAAPR